MPKNILFDDSSEKIANGISTIADAVKSTLGPTGRVVMFEREFGDPVITKDGVTVAKQVQLPDPVENMAAQVVRQAASKTANSAGDGTTTATIMAEAIYNEGRKHIVAGASPLDLKNGINEAVEEIVESLGSMAKPVVDLDQVKQVAICSANHDESVGNMIAEAMDQVGQDGVITIEEGSSLKDSVAVVDGLQFPRGYISQHFATDSRTMLCEYENPMILVYDGRIGDLKLMLKVLEGTLPTGQPCVFIAEFSEDILNFLAINRLKNGMQIVAVSPPGYGDRRRDSLEDIAIATGAVLLGKTGVKDLDEFNVNQLGSCEKVRIDRDTTTIFNGNGDEEKIEDRVDMLRHQLSEAAGDYESEKTQERLARLAGGIAQISVGGATEVEVREKRDRIDDALNACKAAIDEGILPGGAVAVLHAMKDRAYDGNSPKAAGMAAVFSALEAPLRQIAENTGVDAGVVVDKVKSSDDIDFGYDAAKQQYGNMTDFGIIVPAKVERTALQNAASVAALLLTTKCTISIIPQEEAPAPVGPSGLPGGIV